MFPGRYETAPRKTQVISDRASNKRVFVNAQCAHIWAQQKQDDGRTGNGNLYFRGATIYSYRDSWPLATFTGREHDGKRVVLVNSETYSVSTSSHALNVHRALNGLDVLEISITRGSLNSYIAAQRPYYGASEAETAARVNACALAIVQEKIDALANTVERLSNPRKRLGYSRAKDKSGDEHCAATYTELKGGIWRKAAEKRAASLSDSCILETAAALGVTEIPAYDLGALRAKIVASFEDYYSAEKLAKREKDALAREKKAPIDRFYKAIAEREAGGRVSWKRQNALVESLQTIASYRPDYLETAMTRVNAWRLQVEQKDTFDALHPDADSIVRRNRYDEPSKSVSPEEWMAGAKGRFYSDSPTLLRRVGDRLETSRGAEAPFKQAVAIFAKAQQCRATGKTFAPNGERYRAGDFELERIDENGNIKIGCHRIDFAEMQRLAVQQVPDLVAPRFPLPAIV
jgi:hypothetical protein